MSFRTLKRKHKSPCGKMHPNYAMLVLCRAEAVDGVETDILLSLLLTQELEYGGEIFSGVTACTHHTVDLMG